MMEMVCRVLKGLIQDSFRSVKSNNIVDFKIASITQFNLFFGQGNANKCFWKDTLTQQVNQKYGILLESEYLWQYLRNESIMDIIFGRIQAMTGVKFKTLKWSEIEQSTEEE